MTTVPTSPAPEPEATAVAPVGRAEHHTPPTGPVTLHAFARSDLDLLISIVASRFVRESSGGDSAKAAALERVLVSLRGPAALGA